MKITTTYKTNAAGRGQIVAKSEGKQRTHNYDPQYSADTNHGHAAGLLIVHKFPEMVEVISGDFDGTSERVQTSHDSNEAGTVHTFEV